MRAGIFQSELGAALLLDAFPCLDSARKRQLRPADDARGFVPSKLGALGKNVLLSSARLLRNQLVTNASVSDRGVKLLPKQRSLASHFFSKPSTCRCSALDVGPATAPSIKPRRIKYQTSREACPSGCCDDVWLLTGYTNV